MQLLQPKVDPFLWTRQKPNCPTYKDILAFWGSIHQRGFRYNVFFFQIARAVVNNFVRLCRGVDFSECFLIKKCMQGNFTLN